MAQVPYDGGAPTVAPETRTPDDYQHIDAKPEQFGGLLAKGEQQLGAGTEKAAENVFDISQFRGKVNVDYAGNNYIDARNKLLYGDPTQPKVGPDGNPVLGPDGKPMPDTGYMGLEGRAAADQRESVLDNLRKLREQGRADLKSPQEQLEYDNQTRRIYAEAEGHIGVHAEQQWKQWAGGVNKSGAQLSLESYLRNLDNGTEMAHHARDFINYRVQEAQIRFGDTPQVIEATVAGAKQELLKAQVDAVGVHNPKQAIDILEKNRNIAGTQYDDMYNRLRGRFDHQSGVDFVEGQLGRSVDPQIRMLQQIGQRYGISPEYLSRTRQIETGNNPNQRSPTGAEGPFQFIKSTAAQYGVTNPYDFEQAADGAARLARDNKNHLSVSLGRPPSDAELYLAHQQGWFGAWKLLQNPTARAGDLVGDHAIAVNGGNPNAPASQFTEKWNNRFNAVPAQRALDPKSHADIMAAVMNNPNLSDQAKAAGLAHVSQFFQVENARTTDQDRLQRQQEQERKRLSDDTENTVLKDLYSDKPVTTVTSIVQNDHLTREAKERMIGVATRANRGEPLAHVSHDTTVDLINRMRLPADDPSRITDNKPLYDALIAGKLNKADFDWLQKQQTEARSPDGERLAERKKLFMHGVGPIIDKSDPLSQYTDHAGRLKTYEFEFDLDRKIDQYKKEGKDPFDLFNPAKPDYMGKPEALEPYKKRYGASLEDVTADKSGTARPGAPAAPAKFDINQVKSLAELQQAYRDHKIEQWQAQQFAIEKGWAGRKLQPGRIPEPADIRQ